MDYNDLLDFKQKYDETDRDIISLNIREMLRKKKVKVYHLSEILGISINTAYAYTKKQGYTVKPDIFILLLLASYFKIDKYDFLKTCDYKSVMYINI